METFFRCSCILFFALAASASKNGASPIQKVIELLEENKVKIKADLAAEEQEMEEYSSFCDDESSEKAYAIKTAKRALMNLQAKIQDGAANIASFQGEIATLGTDMSTKEQELGSATSERMGGKKEFEGTEKALVKAVDQLDHAIVLIKRSKSLIQAPVATRASASKEAEYALAAIRRIVDASWISSGSRTMLQGLMQTNADAEDGSDLTLRFGQPQAQAFESSGEGIVAQLEDMKEKAEETLSNARSAEMKTQHNFDMLAQSLNNGLKIAKDKLANAKMSKETTGREGGKAKGELVEATKTEASDEAYLASLRHECAAAHANWATRQASAKEEMEVLEKAKSILSDRVKVFAQLGGVSSRKQKGLGDLATNGDNAAPGDSKEDRRRRAIVNKLKTLSQKFGSYALMEMVSAASADPFEKIRGLVQEMIAKLQEEAHQEATQKGFCDEETSKSNAAHDDKTMKVDKLKSRNEKAAATKNELEKSSKQLDADVAALDKGEAEATKIRNEENKSYQKASADFKGAAEATNAALRMLKEYYQGSFIQVSVSAGEHQPQMGGSKSDAAAGIISILEMSAEDFEKLYMQTEQNEAQSSDSYNTLKNENTISRAAKVAEIKGAQSAIKSLHMALKNGKQDLDMTNKELETVERYLEELKPQCETKVMSYEDKKSRREAEIGGLKEALEIIEEPALMQMQIHHLRRHT